MRYSKRWNGVAILWSQGYEDVDMHRPSKLLSERSSIAQGVMEQALFDTSMIGGSVRMKRTFST